MAQQTQAPPRSRGNVSQETQQQNVVIAAERLPVPIGLTERFGYDRAAWRALCEAVFPMAKTSGAIVLALAYCRARRLDPFKRVVHIVPMWNSVLNREVETVWPGIAEHRITASRTGDYAGNDPATFGDWKTQSFKGSKVTRSNKTISAQVDNLRFPEWCQMTLYRMVQGQRVEFHGPRVYFLEYFGYRKGLPVPNERWTRAPAQMLEKCAEAAALRRAYPEELSEPVAEEMDGRVIEAGGVPTPNRDKPPTIDDFPNSQGVPTDGVIQASGDDEDDYSDDPAIQVVEAKPAAQAAPAPVQNGTQAPAQVPAETVTQAPHDTKPALDSGPPADQGSPPAASVVEGGDGRPEPPPPEGVVDEVQAGEKTPAELMGEEVDIWIMDELPKFADLPALRDFQRKARLKIDEAAGVSQADKSRLRGRFNAAVLEREKVVAGMRTRK